MHVGRTPEDEDLYTVAWNHVQVQGGLVVIGERYGTLIPFFPKESLHHHGLTMLRTRAKEFGINEVAYNLCLEGAVGLTMYLVFCKMCKVTLDDEMRAMNKGIPLAWAALDHLPPPGQIGPKLVW